MPEQPHQVPKSGCFSRFFRLLLCAHSTNAPPIHPSDQFPPPQTRPSLPNKPPISTSPSLVARLMGLESLPNTSRVVPDSVTRSKSVNFIDYLLQLDYPTHHDQNGGHRRVRTTSFREVPVLSSPPEKKNGGDVVVFLWDDDDDVDAAARESRPGEFVGQRLKKLQEVGGLKELKKQRKEKKKKKKILKMKDEPMRIRVSVSTSTRMRREEFVEPRFRKKVRSKKSPLKKMKNENLSSVSVLDVGEDEDFALKNRVTNSTDETKGMTSKSKKESLYTANEGGSKTNVQNNKSQTEHCSEFMTNLRKLTENEVQQMFDSAARKGVFGSVDNCFEEIPLVLEHKIFDRLLHEVVHELLTL